MTTQQSIKAALDSKAKEIAKCIGLPYEELPLYVTAKQLSVILPMEKHTIYKRVREETMEVPYAVIDRRVLFPVPKLAHYLLKKEGELPVAEDM